MSFHPWLGHPLVRVHHVLLDVKVRVLAVLEKLGVLQKENQGYIFWPARKIVPPPVEILPCYSGLLLLDS